MEIKENDDGTQTISIEESSLRRITIHVYPNVQIAREILKGGTFGYRIDKSMLDEYIPKDALTVR